MKPIIRNEMDSDSHTKSTDFLDMMNLDYEISKTGIIKIKGMNVKWHNQIYMFIALEEIMTPSSFITLRGEDGHTFGFFFNGYETVEYSNNTELQRLEEKLMLKKTWIKIYPLVR